MQVINTGVKVWSRNSDGEEFGCPFRLAQEVRHLNPFSLKVSAQDLESVSALSSYRLKKKKKILNLEDVQPPFGYNLHC